MATAQQVTITIDGTERTVADTDMEASALLRLAARDPHTYDLFALDGNGVEEHVKDDQIVDLTDGARFRTRHRVRFTIDGQHHTSWDNTQTADALLRLAGVDPALYDLAQVSGAGAPHVYHGDKVVTIEDHAEFVTAKHVGGVA